MVMAELGIFYTDELFLDSLNLSQRLKEILKDCKPKVI